MILGYFRRHKWQGWIATALVSIILGVLGALLVYPHVNDWLLIRDLGSRNAGVREKAVNRAEVAARKSLRTLRKLQAALNTPDDAQFAAIATALNRAGEFRIAGRDPAMYDRHRAIELENAADAEVRRQLAADAVRAGRDNEYVRRLMKDAVRDSSGPVRVVGAVLAAKLGDDAELEGLLADKEPSVVSAAALDAGLAGRQRLAGIVAKLFEKSRDVEVASASAYALVRLEPKAYAGRIGERLKAADSAALRERLLYVLTLADDAAARAAIQDLLAEARKAGTLPSAMLLLAAGRMGIADARTDVKATLASLGKTPPPLESQLLAALETARLLGVPVRAEVYRICQVAWGPQWPFLLMAAARELARQADMPQDDPHAPSREECVLLLHQCATFYMEFPPAKEGEPKRSVTTPMPSAAAAVGLWQMRADDADQDLRAAAGAAGWAPGEYIAWNAAQLRPQDALALGLAMLPASNAPVAQRVYNDNERAGGAMMLALSARSPQEKAQAVRRLRERLVGGQLGGEDNLLVAATYRCCLVMLGQEDMLAGVLNMLGIEDISRWQVVTALCVAGRRDGLDWMLWNTHVLPEPAAAYYLNKGLGEVLWAAAPELPRIDVCGTQSLRLWQAQILRDYYGIHRERVHPGLRR